MEAEERGGEVVIDRAGHENSVSYVWDKGCAGCLGW